MQLLRAHGQGAIESQSAATAGTLVGQGATEYLVLLAVVLIVALVSVALLGFFPGMASDAQEAQSRAYWRSAQPISVVDWAARFYNQSAYVQTTQPYFRVRNTGAYPITITKMLAGNQSVSDIWTSGWAPAVAMSTRLMLAPGEEKDLICPPYYNSPDPGEGNRSFVTFANPETNTSYTSGWTANFQPGAAKSYCTQAAPYGYFIIENFGFQYTTTVDGQTVTKREVGSKPLIVRCASNFN